MDNKTEEYNRIKKEFMLYRVREVEIEDIKLKIEQLEIGDQLGAMGFEERVQTSKNCPNNDMAMNQIENLKKKVKFYELANQRVDNALKSLEDVERQVVTMIFIDKNSMSETIKKLYRSKRQIYYILNNSISKMKIA